VLHVGDDYDVDLPAVEHPLHLGWLGGERHYVVPAPLAGSGAGEQIGAGVWAGYGDVHDGS